MGKLFAVLFCCLTVFGCVQNTDSDVYDTSEANKVSRVGEGVIIDVRKIKLESKDNTGGGVAGGVAGGFIGSTIGEGKGSVLAAVGGALAGAFIGAFTEEELSKQQADQYFIRLTDGQVITVIQSPKNELPVGQKVLILYGRETKLVAQ